MIFGVGGWVEEAEHEAAVMRNESKGIETRGISGLEGERPNFVGTGRRREGNGGVRWGKRNELREGFWCLHCWKPLRKNNVEIAQYSQRRLYLFHFLTPTHNQCQVR